MYSSALSSGDLRDCRRYARAVISASFIASLRHVQTLKNLDQSVEQVRRKLSRQKLPSNAPSDSSSSTATTTPRIKVITIPKEHRQKTLEQPIRPKNWSPITDGKRAINAMIDQMWSIPYAPCKYVVQFICTVSLNMLQRHKYCVRWQNGRRSAMFYVNIDETRWDTNVWVSFPGETKAQRPHSSSANFQRFLQRNLF
ncbi:uncharacterized protein CELE_W03G9.9 [Caenorhabditis elegans]|uniref:Uncharacterized protein n=1 Tax=Caenorhabditis elegans TaxID=6239 RepID=Q4W502_CAEEL|nr:Uncharacterized protein CELE_W03G9.9 [Caenorhabditis elegans]CCD70134.1 Uncharacterized protein CELE_W03G9.9 [Caenorhabditis elegans]|eukprot:NP_001021664.2 Uncharacterized protein CELE_W03G9.9 [Caenorhabditis elegans]